MTSSGQKVRLWSERGIRAATRLALAGVIGAGLAAAQTASPEKPTLAEDVFKNVQVLKGISVDDFLGTMGIMTAALQFDCSDCHVGAGTDKVGWGAGTPRKRMARSVVHMVGPIHKNKLGRGPKGACVGFPHQPEKPKTTTHSRVSGGP